MATASRISTSRPPECPLFRRRSRRSSMAAAIRAARSAARRLFLQDVFSMHDLVVTLSARVDSWKNYDGHIFETSAADRAAHGRTIAATCPTRTTPSSARARQCSTSSRTACRCGATSAAGFRAPTLNELYRQFRVGLIAHAGERNSSVPSVCWVARLGVRRRSHTQRLVRSTWYDNGVKNPVANVTIGSQSRSSVRTSGARAFVAGRTTSSTRVGQYWRVGAATCSTRPRCTEYDPAHPRCDARRSHGPVFAAGAEASRLGQRGIRESAHLTSPSPAASTAGSSTTTRTRASSRVRPRRAAGLRHRGPQRLARRSAAISRSSSACRTSSIRSTTCSCCRRRSARRGWSTVASGFAGPVDSRLVVGG